ncbi:hypothetical protein EV380_0417 [Zhihengliuella halotolerans]|uniref:DUF6318 domain-containing protein n=1 Tax=Zhihengliuella halotolerans TaxID=370736 RepID=A0A4V2G9L8_9MICC|nr:hypothetical protein EV380_0417 [Zhihengliuella halotolerans]
MAGCSGTTPEPSESPSPTSAAPTSSAPPTPKPATSTSPAENLEPPQMPELATEFSVAGFEAFVEYWFDAHNYALATGDVELMMDVSDDRCVYCLNHELGIKEIYEADGWIDGGDVVPSSFFTNMAELEGGLYQGNFTLKQMKGTVYTAEGDVDESQVFDPDDYDYEMRAYHDGDGWVASKIDLWEQPDD